MGFIICYKQTFHFMLQYWCWLYRQIKVLRKKNRSQILHTHQLCHTAQGGKKCTPTAFHCQIALQCGGQACVPDSLLTLPKLPLDVVALLCFLAAASPSCPCINAPQKINDLLREPSHPLEWRKRNLTRTITLSILGKTTKIHSLKIIKSNIFHIET